jgi:nitrate reductase cytochrome c-type subunit
VEEPNVHAKGDRIMPSLLKTSGTAVSLAPRRVPSWPWQTWLLVVGVGAVMLAGLWTQAARSFFADPPKDAPSKPPELFLTWPQSKPALTLLLTGQMYGYLQKCGCSNPQTGGLERRYNFMEWLRKEKGWELLPLDLGDISEKAGAHNRPTLHKQSLLKYQVAMEALQIMGYRTIGIGKEEFRFPLLDALATFTLQDEKAFPKVQAANLLNKDKDFPGVNGSMIKDYDTFTSKDKSVSVGILSMIGKSQFEEIQKIDRTVQFAQKSAQIVKDNLDAIRKDLGKDADVNVMLYQGEMEDAQVVAKMFPQFQLIVCRSPESEPPAQPTIVDKTLIVQVGWKGRNLGLVGLYRENDRWNFYYEKVVVTEDFETTKDKEATQPILKKYDWYAKEVRDRNFLPQYPKAPHAVQSAFPNQKVFFVGSQTCLTCHPSEYTAWSKTKHSHAYEALEKYAKHPSMRNFDGECIVCHTVGFEYASGFDGTEATMKLKDVGCESCHGPGNLHSSNQFKKEYYGYLMPWKLQPTDKLPDAAKMAKHLAAKTPEERAGIYTLNEERVLLRVNDMCQKCHDTDNDPKFNLEKYWPQIAHPSPVKKKN